ncbi:zinc finger protein 385D isoform X3 [Triplophysa dalaica]|uniref:zinc finger protein 385D isoform X3 n=1 Tax=Triplophysa dalaica TaxID=1582913 RepID=UPI0024DF399E|nr:zinc finger protein 385D isoform X3 [Triplophysa dalaica]
MTGSRGSFWQLYLKPLSLGQIQSAHDAVAEQVGMKRPFSPTEEETLTEQIGHRGVSSDGVELTRQDAPPANHRPKRERKHRSYTLCEVCNIQLNSAAQAQIHYNGKTHQKRLKHINNSNTGTAAQGSPLLASLPVQGRPLQSPLDLKHFLPFRLSGSSPLSLFPNFNTMDPVQKAVINHTFGVPQSLKKKQVISCNICHLRFNSTNQAEAHYKGHKHARKMKALEAHKNKQQRRQLDSANHNREREREKDRERDRERDSDRLKTSDQDALPVQPIDSAAESSEVFDSESVIRVDNANSSSVVLTPTSEVSSADLSISSPHSQHTDSPPDASVVPTEQESPTGETQAEKDPKKTKQHLHCPICKVTVNSSTQMEAHNSGTKHKLMMEGQSVLPRRRGKAMSSRSSCKSKRLASKGSVGIASKSFYCEVCEIHVNSETQLSQHMNSRRHKDRLAGKPPKPKFNPHSKSQPSSAASSIRWNGYASSAVSAMKKVITQCNLSSLTSQTKLILQKHLTKNLTNFLPTHLTQPTICTVAANPLALRHPGGTAFIQTPILGPALFRPAPGPLRATHTPIIFSPY